MISTRVLRKQENKHTPNEINLLIHGKHATSYKHTRQTQTKLRLTLNTHGKYE